MIVCYIKLSYLANFCASHGFFKFSIIGLDHVWKRTCNHSISVGTLDGSLKVFGVSHSQCHEVDRYLNGHTQTISRNFQISHDWFDHVWGKKRIAISTWYLLVWSRLLWKMSVFCQFICIPQGFEMCHNRYDPDLSDVNNLCSEWSWWNLKNYATFSVLKVGLILVFSDVSRPRVLLFCEHLE